MENIVRAPQCDEPACAWRRNRARQHTFHCLAHADKAPSPSLTERDGKILCHCFAGCMRIAATKAFKQRRLCREDISLKVKGVNVLMAGGASGRGRSQTARWSTSNSARGSQGTWSPASRALVRWAAGLASWRPESHLTTHGAHAIIDTVVSGRLKSLLCLI